MPLTKDQNRLDSVRKKSCTDHIDTLRIIIQQSIEWQSPLYMTLVDFEKAFDSIDRDVIWRVMSHYRISTKFTNIIKQLYDDLSFQNNTQWYADQPISSKNRSKTGMYAFALDTLAGD
uniref:Uncharacterized protein n=1 Tax=Biomphalaria glabrata TaxID=6526 RepID=A0A2C9LHY7_BIOGL